MVVQPFTVAKIGGSHGRHASTTPATNTPWTGNETVGASAYEASLVSSIAGFPPTGTVEYDLLSGGCAGTIIQTQTVNLNPDGTVPDSKTTGPLGAGNYCFHTYYSGDSNYLSSATFQAAGWRSRSTAQPSPLRRRPPSRRGLATRPAGPRPTPPRPSSAAGQPPRPAP